MSSHIAPAALTRTRRRRQLPAPAAAALPSTRPTSPQATLTMAAAARRPASTSPERHPSLSVALSQFLSAAAVPPAPHHGSSSSSRPPLRRSLQHLPLRSPTPPMAEAAMDAVLKDPVGSLLRQPPASSSRSGSPAAGVTTSSLSLSRNEAVLLEASLSTLPAGSLFCTQAEHLRAWQQQQQQQQQHTQWAHLRPTACNSGGPSQDHQQQEEDLPEVLSEQVVPWQQQLAHIMQQLAHQVSLHCVEHGRSVGVLGERYRELVSALCLTIRSLSTQHAGVSAALAAVSAALETTGVEAAELRRQLATEAAAARDTCANLEAAAARHESIQQESEQSLQLLLREVVALKQRLYDEQQQREQAQAAAAAAAAESAEAQEQRLLQADEDNTELRQRLAFVQARLAAVRCAGDTRGE